MKGGGKKPPRETRTVFPGAIKLTSLRSTGRTDLENNLLNLSAAKRKEPFRDNTTLKSVVVYSTQSIHNFCFYGRHAVDDYQLSD